MMAMNEKESAPAAHLINRDSPSMGANQPKLVKMVTGDDSNRYDPPAAYRSLNGATDKPPPDDLRWRKRKMSNQRKSTISPIIYACVIAFGAASWLHVNGVWVELPLLVHKLPEGWNLPSYLAVIVQLAIVGPLLYSIIEKALIHYRRRNKGDTSTEAAAGEKDPAKTEGVDETPRGFLEKVIAGMLVFAIVASLFMSLFWDRLHVFAGTERSLPFFIIFFAVSLVDCTSNVTFLPYMGALRPPYIVAYFMGMGVSALIPSVLALIQGSGHTECRLIESPLLMDDMGLGTNDTQMFGDIGRWNTTFNEQRQVPVPERKFQASQTPARFTVEVFFGLLLVSVAISFGSFCFLNWSRLGRRERQSADDDANLEDCCEDSEMSAAANRQYDIISREGSANVLVMEDEGDGEDYNGKNNGAAGDSNSGNTLDVPETIKGPPPRSASPVPSTDGRATIAVGKDGKNGEKTNSSEQLAIAPSNATPEPLSDFVYFLLLFLTMWTCALMNGILPSIQSFSCLPYGQTVYHVAACLSNIANPVACFIPFFVQLQSPAILTALTGLVTLISGYAVAMAAMSPQPLMVGHLAGRILIVVVWILCYGLCAYLRTVMAELLRSRSGKRPRALFWCGAATQAGSFVGAMIMFPLVNVYRFFTPAPPCVEFLR